MTTLTENQTRCRDRMVNHADSREMNRGAGETLGNTERADDEKDEKNEKNGDDTGFKPPRQQGLIQGIFSYPMFHV
jgi:hypothetical protein